jgi:hypothetical protein
VMGHSLPKGDVRVTSVYPSISDKLLRRFASRNGPISDGDRKTVQKFSTASCKTVAGRMGVRLSMSRPHLTKIRPKLGGNSDLRSVPLVQPDCVHMIENRLRLFSSAPLS